MAYGLPSRGQADWDDELNNSMEYVRGQAESAAADANNAVSTANHARNVAEAARESVLGGNPDSAFASLIDDEDSDTHASLTASYVVPAGKTAAGAAAPQFFVNVTDYEAVGDWNGVTGTDDAAAIQAAIDAAAPAGAFGGCVVRLPAGNYRIGTTLLLPSHVALIGANPGPFITGSPTILTYTGTAGQPLIAPATPSSDTKNWTIEGIVLRGGSLATPIVKMYRVSNSTLRNLHISGMQAGGVGVTFDANTSNQCYFNVAEQVIVSAAGGAACVRFQNGANANRWEGGVFSGATNGFEFLSASAANFVMGTDLEDIATTSVYVDAPANVFVGLHIERCVNGFDITANGIGTRRFGTTFAAITNWVVDASSVGASLDEWDSDEYRLQVGSTRIQNRFQAGSTNVDHEPGLYSATANSLWRYFLTTNTTGTRQCIWYRGDGGTTPAMMLDFGNTNLRLGDVGPPTSGKGWFAIADSITTGSAAPVGGAAVRSTGGVVEAWTAGDTRTVVAGNVVAKSANATLAIAEQFCLVTTGASTITITLPAARKGSEFLIKKVDNGAGTVTVATTSSQTIDGVTTKSLAAQWNYIRVKSDGTAWFIIAEG